VGCVVTLLERTPIIRPLLIDTRVALAPNAPAVWFTFPDAWHDIGRFHDASGSFTGFYANVLTPVTGLDGDAWETTDLFLDVWLPAAGGGARLLDSDELESAFAAQQLPAEWYARARNEAERLLAAAARGEWPPPVVHEWPLARARAAVARAPRE
jgi:predicted RNA-binding protein associated with RNAse of E/G family